MKLPHELCTTNDSSRTTSGHHGEHIDEKISGESRVSVQSKFRFDAVDRQGISYNNSSFPVITLWSKQTCTVVLFARPIFS